MIFILVWNIIKIVQFITSIHYFLPNGSNSKYFERKWYNNLKLWIYQKP